MKNTYLIAAVVALGLAVPGAFFAGQSVSRQYERSEGAGPMDGDGPATMGDLPLEEVSLGFLVGAGMDVEYRVHGPASGMKDCLDMEYEGEAETNQYEFKDMLVSSYLVPPDWNGEVKVCGQPTGVRVHEPLVPPGQGGEIDDKSSPLLFLGLSQGGREDEPDTREVNFNFRKIGMAEPDEVLVLSALDEQNPTLGARIWMNLSLAFDEEGQWSTGMKIEKRYSVMIELPKELLITKEYDKSTPNLYLAMGAHPEVLSAGAAIDYGLSLMVESEVPVRVCMYGHMEEIP